MILDVWPATSAISYEISARKDLGSVDASGIRRSVEIPGHFRVGNGRELERLSRQLALHEWCLPTLVVGQHLHWRIT